MARIEHLADEQLARFPEFVDKWTRIGLSTEPADRPRAEAAILAMYKQAGLPKPEIVWRGSPMSNVLAWASVQDSVRDSVWNRVWDRALASIGANLGDSMGASVGASVWTGVWTGVRDSVGDSVRDSVRDSVWDSAGDSVRNSVRDSAGEDSVLAGAWGSLCGQHDAHWLGYYDFFREVVGMTKETQKAIPLTHLVQSAGWTIPCKHICFVSERHTTLERDDKGRLHCLAGPAVRYPDGWSIYAVHGVRVPENVVMRPEQITVTAINAERNSEIKRVMIERLGWDRWSAECGAAVIDHDDRWGTLKRGGDVLFLEVVNGSAEPDGSFRRYVLPVDDECRPLPDPESGDDEFGEPQKLTALNAVASTYGMTGKEYAGLHVRT